MILTNKASTLAVIVTLTTGSPAFPDFWQIKGLGLGFRVKGLGFRVWGLGLRV